MFIKEAELALVQGQEHLRQLESMLPGTKWKNWGNRFDSEQEVRRNNIWIRCQMIGEKSESKWKAELGIAGWRIAAAEGNTPMEAVDRVIKRKNQLFQDVDNTFGY